MTRRKHGPATLAAFQGHIEKLEDDLARPPIELPDFTVRGINRRVRERRLGVAERALVWACIALAVLGVIGNAIGGGP